MKWLCRNLYRKEKGFTLVELMVVIIILAVLTGIAIPSYMALRNRARQTAAKAEMTNMATAIELFMSDYSEYPGDGLAELTLELEGAAGGTLNGANQYVYMSSVPQTDPWGGAYTYDDTDGDGSTYTLGCESDATITITDGQASWND